MKFLYIENDKNIQDLYTMKLEADFGATVLEIPNEEQAKSILENDPNMF